MRRHLLDFDDHRVLNHDLGAKPQPDRDALIDHRDRKLTPERNPRPVQFQAETGSINRFQQPRPDPAMQLRSPTQ